MKLESISFPNLELIEKRRKTGHQERQSLALFCNLVALILG